MFAELAQGISACMAVAAGHEGLGNGVFGAMRIPGCLPIMVGAQSPITAQSSGMKPYAMMVHRLDGPDSLEATPLDEKELHSLGPEEVLVEVRAVACNFFDTLITRGRYQRKPPLPFAPGAESAGVVRALGAQVSGVKIGQRVAVLSGVGSYTSHLKVPQQRVFAIPDAMPFDDAAALGIVYQTSWMGLVYRGQLQAGDTLLVHAAAGGVGLAAVQIGVALGAKVIGTAGSEEKLALIRDHGASAVLNYREESWSEELKALAPGGVDVVYDPVGGEAFDLSTKQLAFGARYVVVGFASGTIPTMAMNRVLLKNVAITGIHHAAYFDNAPGLLQQCQDALGDLYEAGKIKPLISSVHPLREAPAALAELASRRTVGKIVLHP